jgi:glycine C-acetyltransferase
MDGTIARLDKIRDLCDRYGALLGIDECHASGFMGRRPRHARAPRRVWQDRHHHRHAGQGAGRCLRRLHRGAQGSGRTAAPALAALPVLQHRGAQHRRRVDRRAGSAERLSTALRDKLEANTTWFRRAITAAGFEIKPGEHPIVPIMVYDAVKAQQLAARLLELGVYVVGFFFPVVPKGQARIRVQMSAGHDRADLERAVAAFRQAGLELGLVK